MSSNNFHVDEKGRDRYSRIGEMSIGGKKVRLPNYMPILKNRKEFELYFKLSSLFPLDFVNSFVMKLSDSPDRLLPVEDSPGQMRLEMNGFKDQKIHDFYNNTMIVIDPSSEYLFYEFELNKLLKKLKYINNSTGYLYNVTKYLELKKENKENNIYGSTYYSWKKSSYKDFWKKLDRNQMELSKLIGEIHDLEMGYKSDLLLPFVPIVDDLSSLDISIRINRISNAIAKINSASYLIIQKSVLKNDKIVEKIIDYILSDSSKIMVMKFKYLSLWEPGNIVQRNNYRKIMRTMAYMSEEDKDKAYMVLENSLQCYPSACVGFDIVSTSLTCLDGDQAFGRYQYGGWLDFEQFWNVPFVDLQNKFQNNGYKIPCDCPACTSIESLDSDYLKPKEWYALRREHVLYKMNDMMHQIENRVRRNEIELVSNELSKSEISKLVEIIPRN